jgi:hypothetical protein
MAKHSLVKVDLPGTGLRDPTQGLPPLLTVRNDYKMKFGPQQVYKHHALVFVDEEAKGSSNPWWYGVSVREDVLPDRPEFKEKRAPINIDTVHIFFHPIAEQARDGNGNLAYLPKEYSPNGPWIKLWDKYVTMMGLQIAASRKSQIFVMPLVRSSAGLGNFVTDWREIVTQIVARIQNLYDPSSSGSAPATIRHLVVSSFSAGIANLHQFLNGGKDVRALARTVIDLDGINSSFPHFSQGLAGTGLRVLAYDQAHVTPKGPFQHLFGRGYRIHVPGVRWPNSACPPDARIAAAMKCDPATGMTPNFYAVHGLIPVFMMYDALMMSSV